MLKCLKTQNVFGTLRKIFDFSEKPEMLRNPFGFWHAKNLHGKFLSIL